MDSDPSGTEEERGMRTRREVLGDDHVARAIASTTEFTAPFQDLVTKYAWGEVWKVPAANRAFAVAAKALDGLA